jgi:hypothetical protein
VTTSLGEHKLYLRSPEAILYYLGELARVQVDEGEAPVMVNRKNEKGPWPLFKVMRAPARRTSTSSQLSVDYRGNTFAIPADQEEAGRSMQVIWLVSQLLALHKSAEELPTTQAVTVVTQ